MCRDDLLLFPKTGVGPIMRMRAQTFSNMTSACTPFDMLWHWLIVALHDFERYMEQFFYSQPSLWRAPYRVEKLLSEKACSTWFLQIKATSKGRELYRAEEVYIDIYWIQVVWNKGLKKKISRLFVHMWWGWPESLGGILFALKRILHGQCFAISAAVRWWIAKSANRDICNQVFYDICFLFDA